MAQFNPNVPATNDPNYLGYSRPITQPEADKTFASLFSGIGNIISSGAQAVKDLSERAISQQLRQSIEPQRDEFIDQLQGTVTKLAQANPQTAAAIAAGTPPPGTPGYTAQPDTQSTDIMPYAEENKVNPSIQGGLDQIKQIQNAKTIKPELRTLYDGKMLAIAREMRARYPGQVDFIDQKISEITGGNPANKMITDSLASIQAYLAANQADKAKIEGFLLHNVGKIPNADLVYQYYKNTGDAAGALRYINNANATKMKVEAKELNQKDSNLDRDERAQDSLQNLNLLASEHVASTMDLATLNLTINGQKITTGNQLLSKVQDIMSGKEKINERDTIAMAQAVASLEQRARVYLNNEATKVRPDGSTMQAKIDTKYGPDRTKQTIENYLTTTFGALRDNISKGRWDLAATNVEWSRAAISDKTREILDSPNGIGEVFRLQGAIEKISPNASQQFFNKMLENSGLTGNLKRFFDYEAMKIGAQPDPNNPVTIRHSIERAQKIFPDTPKSTLAKLNNNLINSVGTILSSGASDELKINTLKSAFDPYMKGFIGTVPMDTVDQNGRPIPGKYSVFRRLTSPDILKEVIRLDQARPDLGIKQNYENWMRETFSFDLLGRDLPNMREMLSEPGVVIRYNSVDHRFDAESSLPKQSTDPATRITITRSRQVSNNRVAVVQRTLNRINYGMQSVMEYAKATGQDPEGYVLQLMANAGLDIQKEIRSSGEGLAKAIVSSRMKQMAPK